MQVLVLIPQRVAGLATNGSKRFLEASIFSVILRFTGAILWRKEIYAFLLMKALNILVMRTKNFKIRILCFSMIKKNYLSMILIWLNIFKQANFKIEYLSPDVDIKEITATVRGPSGEIECHLDLTPTGGSGTFIPTEVGMHEVCNVQSSFPSPHFALCQPSCLWEWKWWSRLKL